MNATPKTMARQITVARQARANAPVRTVSRLAYSTSTGDVARSYGSHATPQNAPEPEPFCFICSRATDHFAEHDDAVESGEWEYREDGSVVPVGGWLVVK